MRAYNKKRKPKHSTKLKYKKDKDFVWYDVRSSKRQTWFYKKNRNMRRYDNLY